MSSYYFILKLLPAFCWYGKKLLYGHVIIKKKDQRISSVKWLPRLWLIPVRSLGTPGSMSTVNSGPKEQQNKYHKQNSLKLTRSNQPPFLNFPDWLKLLEHNLSQVSTYYYLLIFCHFCSYYHNFINFLGESQGLQLAVYPGITSVKLRGIYG